MNTVYAATDAKKITALVGLDISAAFDTIDHDVLASRLESQFGVVGAASSWLRSYLRGHQFADDTQLLVSMDSTNATPAVDRLAHCSAAVRLWSRLLTQR